MFLDENGDFSTRKYNAYLKAVETVAAKFGDVCPLSTSKAVTPRDGWHERRWLAFKQEDAQYELISLMPNTEQIVPIRPKKDEKKK